MCFAKMKMGEGKVRILPKREGGALNSPKRRVGTGGSPANTKVSAWRPSCPSFHIFYVSLFSFLLLKCLSSCLHYGLYLHCYFSIF